MEKKIKQKNIENSKIDVSRSTSNGMKIKNRQKDKGFTLIELMVATSIFVIIMLAAMSSLFVLLNAGKNSRALSFAMDNINFSMESMTRSIRMGTNYYCGTGVYMSDSTSSKDCLGGETAIAFIPQTPIDLYVPRVVYKIYPRSDGTTYTLQRCDTNGCVDIVSSDVDIKELKFFVKGSEPSATPRQPSVYIIIKGTIMVKGVPTSFAIQTMASQRNF